MASSSRKRAKTYSEDHMMAAVETVKGGAGVRNASRACNLLAVELLGLPRDVVKDIDNRIWVKWSIIFYFFLCPVFNIVVDLDWHGSDA